MRQHAAQHAREHGGTRVRPAGGVARSRVGHTGHPGRHELTSVLQGRDASRHAGPQVVQRIRRAQPRPSPFEEVRSAIGRDTGTPLPAELQRRWSSRLGADLSGIRVHADQPAVSAGGCRAMNLGSHLFFAPGAFDTASSVGQALIGHEVAHALQAPAPAGARGSLRIATRESQLEGEADDVGARLAAPGSEPIRVRAHDQAPALRGDKQITFSGTTIIVSDVYVLEGPGATAPGFLQKFQNALATYYTTFTTSYRGYNVKFDLSVRYRTIGDSRADPATSLFWIETGTGRAGGISELTLYTTDTALTIAHEVGHYLSDYFGIFSEGYTENPFKRLASNLGLGEGGVATAKPGCENDIMGTGNQLTACSLSGILDEAIDNAPVLPPIGSP